MKTYAFVGYVTRNTVNGKAREPLYVLQYSNDCIQRSLFSVHNTRVLTIAKSVKIELEWKFKDRHLIQNHLQNYDSCFSHFVKIQF